MLIGKSPEAPVYQTWGFCSSLEVAKRLREPFKMAARGLASNDTPFYESPARKSTGRDGESLTDKFR